MEYSTPLCAEVTDAAAGRVLMRARGWRDAFVAALAAGGIPVARGYRPLYRQGLLAACFESDSRAFCPRDSRGTVRYEHADCPVAEHMCTDGSFWMPQETLGSTRDMDDVADAILRIRDNLKELVDLDRPAQAGSARWQGGGPARAGNAGSSRAGASAPARSPTEELIPP